MSAKTRVKVRVVWFAYEKKSLGPVTMGLLRPVDVYETEEVGNPVEVMLSVTEAISRRGKGDYVEVRVEGAGVVEVMGESPRYRAQRLLFPRPVRLRRLGVVRAGKARPAEGSGYAVIRLEDVEWINLDGEYYVYEGTLQASDDVLAVYLDTEEGPRILFNPAYERRLKDVLARPRASGGSQEGEPGGGGDSSP